MTRKKKVNGSSGQRTGRKVYGTPRKKTTLRDVVKAARDNGMDVKIGIVSNSPEPQTIHEHFTLHTVNAAQAAKIAETIRQAQESRIRLGTQQPGKTPLGTSREEIQKSIDADKATRFDTAGIDGERAHQFAEEQFKAYNRADVKLEETFGKLWREVRAENGDYLLPGHRVEGYMSLEGVLFRAYDQAARGKGYDRHGRGAKFSKQPTQVISSMLDTDAGLAFQAIKKVNEGMRLEHDAKIKEMLGAINYIASIVIYMEANKK